MAASSYQTLKVVFTAVLLAELSGCYVSSQPIAPFGHLSPLGRDAWAVAVSPLIAGELHSEHVIILERFSTSALQPVSASFDFGASGASPLTGSYWMPAAELDVFEAMCDALRAAGLQVRKDYAGTAGTMPLPTQPDDPNPVGIQVSVSHLQVDRIAPETHAIALQQAQLTAQVRVFDSNRVTKLARDIQVSVSLPAESTPGALAVAGMQLAAELANDPRFRQAIEVSRGVIR